MTTQNDRLLQYLKTHAWESAERSEVRAAACYRAIANSLSWEMEDE